MSLKPTPEDIASWPAPNYVNPDTRQPLVLGVEIPLVVLVVIFTSMRFYSRAVLIRALGADDWFMLAAAVTAVGTSIMTCISTLPEFQTGYHLWDLRPEILANPVKTAQMAMATQLLFVPITAFTKISIVLTYLRIFPSSTNKWFCYLMLAFTTVWSIPSFFVALFQCKPAEAYWQQAKYPNPQCINVAVLYYVTGCTNILSDFLIFLWPAKHLAKVQISFKQRVTLISMFSLGVLICVAGICRIWYTSVFVHSYDGLWHGSALYAIIAIETSVGIICGCLPACKPLMSRLMPRIFTTTHSSTHRSTHKKVSKIDGQSFNFTQLSGGIIKEEGYSVEYDNVQSPYRSHALTTNVTVIKNPQHRDHDLEGESLGRSGSEEWIMMQDNPKGLGRQNSRSGV